MDEREISDIIERVRRRVGEPGPQLGRRMAVQAELAAPAAGQTGDGVFARLDDAVAAASEAFRTNRLDPDRRKVVIEAVRRATFEQAEMLARLAVEETGLGRVDDKTVKNRLVASKTAGPEDLEVLAVSGANGMMLTEWAPFGVVGSITPVTNPAATIINNAISIVSAGNAVVFNAHPSARRTSNAAVRIINRAITSAGGPANFVTSVAEPSIESARALMAHPNVRVLLVTGGPGVVREALRTEKRAITAGPGNPPAVVDETADVDKAGADIVRGASFDNNIVCTDEKTAIAVAPVAERLVRAMARSGAYVLAEHELRRLERVIFTDLGAPGQARAHEPGLDRPGRGADPGRDRGPPDGRAAPPGGRGARRAQPRLDRADDAGAARGPGTGRGRRDRPRGAVGARVPPHGLDPLHERGDHHAHGAGDELLDLRHQRPELQRPR